MDQGHVAGNGSTSAPCAAAGVGAARAILFPPFRLDVAAERLWRGSEPVALKPRAFAILRYLLEHPRRLVTKGELLTQVWGEVHVNDAVLKTHLREIRRALEDDVQSPRFIETAHRRGYRFIARTEDEGGGSEASHAALPSVVQAAGEPAARSLGTAAGTTVTGTTGTGTTAANPAPATRAPPVQASAPSVELPPPAAFSALPHFVGRVVELDWLTAALGQARQGERQVVLVNGPAGIGKTSLVRAFSSRLAQGEVSLAWGQCVDQCGSDEAYLPLIEALSRLGRGPNRERWVELLGHCAPGWVARLPTFRARNAAAHAAPAEGASSEHLLCQLADALETFTQYEPLLLVLEDIQWADASTLAWLAYMARRTDPARLLVVCTFRSLDVSRRAHPLSALKRALERQSSRAELKLPYLSQGEVQSYVAARFPECAMREELVRLLHARTAGNPLFMVRVIDAWIERGLLVQRAGQWQLTGDAEAMAGETPDSVVSLLEQEYEQLTELESSVIDAASVAGQEFSVAAIASALSAELVSVEDVCVRWAKHGQFFRLMDKERLPDGTLMTRLGFVHPLYRETAYLRLGASRQAHLHLCIGRWQERCYGARSVEVASELAFHFERGQDYRRAALHVCSAGERALATGAYADATRHFEHALGLVRHLPEGVQRAKLEIRLQVGVATLLAATRGNPVEKERAARAAVAIGTHFLEAANARQDEAARLRATLLLGMAEACLGDLQSARARLEEAMAPQASVARNETQRASISGPAPAVLVRRDPPLLARGETRSTTSQIMALGSNWASPQRAVLALTWRAMLCTFLGEAAANDGNEEVRSSSEPHGYLPFEQALVKFDAASARLLDVPADAFHGSSEPFARPSVLFSRSAWIGNGGEGFGTPSRAREGSGATEGGEPGVSPAVQWVEGLLRQALAEVDAWFGDEAIVENDLDAFEPQYGYRFERRAAEGSRWGSPGTPPD